MTFHVCIACYDYLVAWLLSDQFEYVIDDHNMHTLYMILLLLIRYGYFKIVQFLVNGKHCNTEAVDKYGQTPLHYAMK